MRDPTEKLSGARRGGYNIRINEQWQICFVWVDGNAHEVGIIDYYRNGHIRGFERWMLDTRDNPAVYQAIAERIFHINITLVMQLLDRVGATTDIVSTGDDLGWSQAPYMSPRDFRTLIKPYYRTLISTIKDRYPYIKFYLHSHGQIMDLVPDLIECGVDILNPVLPLGNMDPILLKRKYGKSTIDTLGEGGGY